MLRKFKDGLVSLTNSLINSRNATATNTIQSERVEHAELRAIYRTGIGSKILRLKAGPALDDTLTFESDGDKEFYRTALAPHVKDAVKFMLAFGRGLVVIHEPGADLSQPLGTISDWSRVKIRVFSGDMVYVSSVNVDLTSPDYLKPRMYSVRAFQIHPSRCVDFRYVRPVELDLPEYQYGGISEFELIREELVSDGVVRRAVPSILEKNSSLFYKIKGFKELLADKQEEQLVTYFTMLESLRSIYGAGLVDAEDIIETHDQTLTNLDSADMITLRRLAMVTGIPMAMLVGENVKGLNSTGDNEMQAYQDMIESLQSDYILEELNRLMRLCGRQPVEFKENQGDTPASRITYESNAIDNAFKLWQMGEDYSRYLEDKGVVTPDPFDEMFGKDEPPALALEPPAPGMSIDEMLKELAGDGTAD